MASFEGDEHALRWTTSQRTVQLSCSGPFFVAEDLESSIGIRSTYFLMNMISSVANLNCFVEARDLIDLIVILGFSYLGAVFFPILGICCV